MSQSSVQAEVSSETFQTIIEERKAERKEYAKLVHQKNKQYIENLNSKVGIDPLDRFPKEIWKIILDQLDGNDKRNMCKVHDIFRDLTKDTQIPEYLFPQIVGEKVVVSSYEFEERCPIAHFVNLRGVCKSLRDAVDRYYENNLLSILRMENIETVRYPSKFTFSLPCFRNVREIIKISTWGPEAERPKTFFCRSMSVILIPFFPNHLVLPGAEVVFDDIFTQFKNDVTTFIELVGDQVWHFRFQLEDMDEWGDSVRIYLSQMYRILHGWLTLMPNLKWLELGFQSSVWGTSVDPNSVTEVLATLPFPTLHHLERVDFVLMTWNKDVVNVCEAVLAANQHIKILRVGGDECWWDRISPEKILSLNLESMSIGDFDGYAMSSCQRLINPRWQLKKLDLNLNMKKDENVTINSIFQFLHNFPALERVGLELSTLNLGDKLTYLKLPNLLHFKFKMPDSTKFLFNQNFVFLFSLQFLLRCNKLKFLEWKNDCFDTTKLWCNLAKYYCPEKMVNFGGGWIDLSDSNIWNVFPDLEQIKLNLFKRSGKKGRMLRKKYYKRSLVTLNAVDFDIQI